MKRMMVFAMFLLTASCAELKVKVDVASPQIVEDRVGRLLMRDNLPDALRQAGHGEEVDGLVMAAVELLRRQYIDDALRVPDAFAPHRTSSPEKEKRRADALGLQFDKEVAPQYDVLRKRWTSVNTSIADSYAAFSLCDRCYSRWRESLNRGGLWLIRPASKDKERNASPQAERWWRRSSSASPTKDSAGEVKRAQNPGDNDNECAKVHARPDCGEARNTESFLIALLKEREAIIQQIEKVLHQARVDPSAVRTSTPLHSLIGEDGLFRSAEAYAVASADDSLWTQKFDDSQAVAFFGDVNVALKMETRGSFTVKGLSFDPSEIARVASRVVTQTLVAATQPATLAVLPKRQQIAAEESGVDTAVEVGERERHRRDALLSIANAVIEEEAAFKDGGASDQAALDAVESINRTWNALKPLVLLEPAKAVEADVVGIVPDKALLAPGQSSQLLIALSRKPTEDVPLLVQSSDKTVVAVTTPSPVKIAAGTQSQVIEIKAQDAALGSSKISASDAEGNNKDALACVLPVIDIADATLVGPSEQEVTVTLKDFAEKGTVAKDVQVPSDINLAVGSAGADVKVSNVLAIPKDHTSGKLKVSPRQKGEATISVSLTVTNCPARVASRKFSIVQSSVTMTCPATVEVGKDGDCTVSLKDEPPAGTTDGLKLTPSSDSEAATIVDATPLNPATKDDAEHLKFKIHGAKAGKAKIKVASSQSIFADPTPFEVEVKDLSSNPSSPANQ